MNLHVARSAVAEARAPQIVKGGRHTAQCGRCADIGVALETQRLGILAFEHARIGGAVRFVTSAAPLEAYRRVLEYERAALISVALEATRLVGGNGSQR